MRRKHRGVSKYLGVSWISKCKKWQTRIVIGGRRVSLGYFNGEEDAARAYDQAVIEHRDHEAETNFPRTDYGLSALTIPETPVGARLIPLTKNKFAIVDEDMFEYLMQWKWCANLGYKKSNTYYAVRNHEVSGKQQMTLMHRLVMQCPDNLEVDHINGETLDNRRHKLRICTNITNMHGHQKRRGTTKYRGVYWAKREKRWRAAIENNGRKKSLGSFDSEEEAARAFDRAVIKTRDSQADTNFPRDDYIEDAT